jgi:hypothetical protein
MFKTLSGARSIVIRTTRSFFSIFMLNVQFPEALINLPLSFIVATV